MYNNHINKDDLPSKEQLIRSTKKAFFIALAILVCIVYPAEYGIDPLFVGRLLGLTEMGKIKVSLQKDIDAQKEKMFASQQEKKSQETNIDNSTESTNESGNILELDQNEVLSGANNVLSGSSSLSGTKENIKTDTMVVIIQPDEGLEIKALMTQGQSITYERNVDVGHLNFDSHGESDDGQVAYYGEGRKETSDSGKIIADFEGKHGWFFRNRAGEAVTLTLKVSGNYQELKKL